MSNIRLASQLIPRHTSVMYDKCIARNNGILVMCGVGSVSEYMKQSMPQNCLFALKPSLVKVCNLKAGFVSMVDADEIDFVAFIPQGHYERPREPVIIKGGGDVTIFGMNNKFKDEFPNELCGKLAPEEFQESMRKINTRLERSLPNHVRWLICGLLCCFCTAGCSLWPVIHLNRRTRRDIEKILEAENIRLYCNIGLRLSLIKQRSSETTALMEYVLRIDHLPKACIYLPD